MAHKIYKKKNNKKHWSHVLMLVHPMNLSEDHENFKFSLVSLLGCLG